VVLTSPLSRWFLLRLWKKYGASPLGKHSAIFNFFLNSKNELSILLSHLIGVLGAIFGSLQTTLLDRDVPTSIPKVFETCPNLGSLANLIRVHERDITRSTDS
jgi:hypothetical protein